MSARAALYWRLAAKWNGTADSVSRLALETLTALAGDADLPSVEEIEQLESAGRLAREIAERLRARSGGVVERAPASEPFCACGRVVSRCDGSRAGCHGREVRP